jgi:hypothetical protein
MTTQAIEIERVERDEEYVTLRAGELWAIVRYDRDHGNDLAGWVIEYSDGDSSQCPDSREDGIVHATDWLRTRLKRDGRGPNSEAVGCECGAATGERCAWEGPSNELVTVEHIAECWQENIRAAMAGVGGSIWDYRDCIETLCVERRVCAPLLCANGWGRIMETAEGDDGQGRRHYTYRMPWGDLLHISARLEEPGALIEYGEPGEDGDITWHPTGMESANALHTEVGLLRAMLQRMGSDWYAAPGEDHADALERAFQGAQLIREEPMRG